MAAARRRSEGLSKGTVAALALGIVAIVSVMVLAPSGLEEQATQARLDGTGACGAVGTLRMTALEGAVMPNGQELVGVSGLSRGVAAPEGAESLLVVAERLAFVVPLTLHPETGAAAVDAGGIRPLTGVPRGHDTESLGVTADGRLLFGTETMEEPRASDAVLVATGRAQEVTGTGTLSLAYGPFPVKPRPNKGLEGLSIVAGTEGQPERLVVAGETVDKRGTGGRFAPLAVRQIPATDAAADGVEGADRWKRAWVGLTTKRGKLSALSCEPVGTAGALTCYAIERHYGTVHLVAVDLPAAAGWPGPETPTLPARCVADLAPHLADHVNLEGLELLDSAEGGAKRFALVSDNDSGGVKGPTYVGVLTLE